MKKYIIDDLITDEQIPATEKREQKPKGKYTAVALIVTVLIAGYFLIKMITGSSTDINATKETKTADTGVKELLEPNQEKPVPAGEEAQKVADKLSIAITELDSLALPTTELKSDEIVAAKTEELLEKEPEPIVSAEEVQKIIDEPSVATTGTRNLQPSIVDVETKSLEPPTLEEKKDEISTAGTEKLPETKQETITPVEQELQRITDILATVSATETPAEKSKSDSENSTDIATENDESTPKIESTVTQTPDTKAEKSASEKERETDGTDKKKVKSKPKPKPKQNGFFNLFSKKSKYYIQVGSFKGNPPASFLSKVRNSGLKYKVIRSKKSRTIRVIIGPYSSQDSAKKSIGKINKAIGVKGVIVK